MYTAGWNSPGYLPEMEPGVFETTEDAKRFLIDEAKLREDQAETEDEAEEWCHFAEDLNLWTSSDGSSDRAPDGSEWWIHPE